MRTFKLVVAYDGTLYSGWQLQPNRPTIQGAIETALHQVTLLPTRVTGSGRTDAGVHAWGQAVSFDSATRLSPAELLKALNARLPDDIHVLSVHQMPRGFHAIRHCTGKRYRYQIHDGPPVDPFHRLYVWHLYPRLDVAAMHRAGQVLLGRHDFKSFQSQGTPRQSTIRTVRDLVVRRQPPPDQHQIVIEVEADGFLYNMVRTIVGTLVRVGRGFKDEGSVARILAARDRRQAGMTAPPQGLFLLESYYDGPLGTALAPDQPADTKVTESVDQPADTKVTEPVDQPADTKVTEPVDQPADTKVTESVDQADVDFDADSAPGATAADQSDHRLDPLSAGDIPVDARDLE